jgi:hypothetical protein
MVTVGAKALLQRILGAGEMSEMIAGKQAWQELRVTWRTWASMAVSIGVLRFWLRAMAPRRARKCRVTPWPSRSWALANLSATRLPQSYAARTVGHSAAVWSHPLWMRPWSRVSALGKAPFLHPAPGNWPWR